MSSETQSSVDAQRRRHVAAETQRAAEFASSAEMYPRQSDSSGWPLAHFALHAWAATRCGIAESGIFVGQYPPALVVNSKAFE